MKKFIQDIPIGQRFNRLTVCSEKYRKNDKTYVQAICDCGKQIEVHLAKLKNGHTKGCGCMKIGNRTHYLSKHPLYRIWDAMRYRCNNENSSSYKRYGGRGIKVCKEWEIFENFYNWAIDNNWQKGLQIDRINNDGDYSPLNCRITTPKENSNNRRSTVYICLGTVVYNLSEAIELGVVSKNKYGKNINYRNSIKLTA